MLPELLSKATKIPVVEVTDAMKLESNRVYVMPSNVNIALTDGHFALTKRIQDRSPYLPIDTFMRTLAKVHKSQSIGVILSGTASDGTAGVEAICAEDGVTFAQDPETAKFDGMPRSAIESGNIDFILSPQRIAEELAWMASHPNSRRTDAESSGGENEDNDDFNSILALISASQGANFREYKSNTIRRRTQQRMAALKISTLAEYRTYLEAHSEEITKLANHILVGVTEFFRNPEVFEELSNTVFPAIAGVKPKELIRIWVVACSSGEEVYSLAITLLEFLGARAFGVRIQIFGTDISDTGVAKARAGIYSEGALKNVSEARISKYFTKVIGGYQVNKVVRELCVFARQDVTRDPPFSNLDLISCRNFLIYVQPVLQEKIISTLHYALNPSGFLLLGNAESAASYPELFTAAGERSKVYSKKEFTSRPRRTLKSSQNRIRAVALPAYKEPLISSPGRKEAALQQIVDRVVLSEHAPMGVIVNDALDIIHFCGRTSLYMEPASGRVNFNLLNMVREDLAVPLRIAIAAAKRKAGPVKKKNVAFEHNGKRRLVNLSLFPIDEPDTSSEHCLLILFEAAATDAGTDETKIARAPLKPGDLLRRRIVELTSELHDARGLLREHQAEQESLRENYQASNEELLSANEELQSTNEELETSKEELESTNEELTTVNDELNSSNSALHLVGNDLKNLLESTVLPIVMVDSSFCIRRMTPMAATIFKVLPSDFGRSITDIKPDFDVDLKPLLTVVLRDAVSLEREVQDQQGHWYRLQVRPYRTFEDRIDGAVLVLVDIDAIKKRNEELLLAGDLTMSIIETMPQPVLVLTAELRVLMANQSFYRCFGAEPVSTLSQYVYDLGHGQWNKSNLRFLLEEVLPEHTDFTNHEVVFEFPEIGWRSFILSGRYMKQEPDIAPLILLSFTDTTQRKKTEAALIQSEKLAVASRLAASVAHEVNNPLAAITNLLYLASTGDDLEVAQKYSAQALEEVARVSQLTQQTLKFYRQASAPSSVQISEVVDSLLLLFRGKLLDSKITVDRQFGDEPPIVCLAGDLRQIFANIIVNAIDAMRFGGRLVIRVSEAVDWRDRKTPGIRITFADSGTGMSMETRRRIYEPFFTTKQDETGTGLGMWVSAQIVERLSADLRVWSTTRPGMSGSAFSLFVPLQVSKEVGR
jgi:two-component system CheB/CheR fusion protein